MIENWLIWNHCYYKLFRLLNLYAVQYEENKVGDQFGMKIFSKSNRHSLHIFQVLGLRFSVVQPHIFHPFVWRIIFGNIWLNSITHCNLDTMLLSCSQDLSAYSFCQQQQQQQIVHRIEWDVIAGNRSNNNPNNNNKSSKTHWFKAKCMKWTLRASFKYFYFILLNSTPNVAHNDYARSFVCFVALSPNIRS